MKILFTTVAEKKPDYFDISISRFFRITLPTPSFGLRFLKENVPGISILEYPTLEEFKKAVKGAGILGISFYMKDLPLVRKMVRIARKSGVKEVWGGNYGVLCEEANNIFDRVFAGHCEDKMHKLIHGEKLGRLKHPLLDTKIGVRFSPLKMKYGFLFTSRGCKFKCTFCQTVPFAGKDYFIPLKSIEEVLIRYKKKKVNFIFIMDENFMLGNKHSEAVINLLEKHRFAWGVCTRAENLAGRVAELRKKGMVDCIIGLESLREDNLKSIRKCSSIKLLVETIKELNRNNIYIHATYMIGFENDTVKSIKKDIKTLKKLGIDSFQLCVLTPFPKTPLWDLLNEKYGLHQDPKKYDAYQLAWNHPNITFKQMQSLLSWSKKQVYSVSNIWKGLMKLYKNKILKRSKISAW